MTSTQKILETAKDTVKALRAFGDGEINTALIKMADALIKNTEKITS
jgi:gamma-glutamyl phosphate reductase